MSIWTIIVGVVAICGLVWVYPKLPAMGQLILVIVVAVACVMILLSLAGVNTGIHA